MRQSPGGDVTQQQQQTLGQNQPGSGFSVLGWGRLVGEEPALHQELEASWGRKREEPGAQGAHLRFSRHQLPCWGTRVRREMQRGSSTGSPHPAAEGAATCSPFPLLLPKAFAEAAKHPAPLACSQQLCP